MKRGLLLGKLANDVTAHNRQIYTV